MRPCPVSASPILAQGQFGERNRNEPLVPDAAKEPLVVGNGSSSDFIARTIGRKVRPVRRLRTCERGRRLWLRPSLSAPIGTRRRRGRDLVSGYRAGFATRSRSSVTLASTRSREASSAAQIPEAKRDGPPSYQAGSGAPVPSPVQSSLSLRMRSGSVDRSRAKCAWVFLGPRKDKAASLAAENKKVGLRERRTRRGADCRTRTHDFFLQRSWSSDATREKAPMAASCPSVKAGRKSVSAPPLTYRPRAVVCKSRASRWSSPPALVGRDVQPAALPLDSGKLHSAPGWSRRSHALPSLKSALRVPGRHVAQFQWAFPVSFLGKGRRCRPIHWYPGPGCRGRRFP